MYQEAPALRLNSTRAHNMLGWQARWALPHAAHVTARWYRAYLTGTPAAVLLDADIDTFEKRPA